MTKNLLQLSILTAVLSVGNAAFAASATANVAVSATVSKTCSITATPLAFGDYDPIGVNATADKTGTGSVTVACAKGASSLTIGMSDGAHVSGTQRQMEGPTTTDLLSYNLFQPSSTVPGAACPGTIPWTATGAGLMALSVAPSKAARTYNVCGTIPQGQDASAGVYNDIVVATVNF
jgi:spore coat protein U-like protein